ncbi:MAG: hypothetical protein ACTSR8_19840 [Promethearchaeota archaeon]
MSFEKKSPKNLIKFYCKLNVILNILSIVFSISNFVIPIESSIFSFVGLIVVCSWLVNILLLLIENHYIDKTNLTGIRINRLSYKFIIIFIIIILFSILSSIIVQSAMNLEGIYLILFPLFILLGVVLLSIFGIFFTFLLSSSLEISGVWKFD